MIEDLKKAQETVSPHWIFKKIEECSNRYIEAERFLLKIENMSWIKRILCKKEIRKYLKECLKKYDF
jgi:hypothetical protein